MSQRMQDRLAGLWTGILASPLKDWAHARHFALARERVNEANEDFRDFLSDFFEEIDDFMLNVGTLLASLEAGGEVSAEAYDAAYRACHKLKGSSATLGYEAVASVAYGLEKAFEDLREGTLPTEGGVPGLLREAHAIARDCLDELRSDVGGGR